MRKSGKTKHSKPKLEEQFLNKSNQRKMSLAGAATLTFLGLFEGYAFYRCGMYAPVVLESQMRFQKFIVMKVFFSAVAVAGYPAWDAPVRNRTRR